MYRKEKGNAMRYSSAHARQLKSRKGKPWQAVLRYKDPSGKWKDITKMLPDAKGKRDAEKLAREWLDEMNKAAGLIPSTPQRRRDRQTVGEVVTQYIDNQLALGKMEKSTYNNDKFILNKRIIPYIGDILFLELDRIAIADWITKLSQEGLSQHYIYRATTIVNKVYNYYLNAGEIAVNPFKQVRYSKGKGKRITHLTKEQMDEFVIAIHEDFTPEDKMYPALFLAFYAGLRRGEICGLRWNDVDFERNTLTVSSAIGIAANESYTKTPKNESSFRTFPMIPQLRQALEEVYEAKQPKREWYVCGDKTKFYVPSSFSSCFKRFVVRHELRDAYGKYITPHGLRHNLGAVGIRSDMDIASLSLMFGHSSRSMTLDTYGDANEDAKLLAAEKLSSTFQTEMDAAQGYTEEE